MANSTALKKTHWHVLQQPLTNLGLIRLWEMTQSQKDQDNVKPLSKDSVFKFIESRMVVTEPEVKTWGITI